MDKTEIIVLMVIIITVGCAYILGRKHAGKKAEYNHRKWGEAIQIIGKLQKENSALRQCLYMHSTAEKKPKKVKPASITEIGCGLYEVIIPPQKEGAKLKVKVVLP